VPKVVACEEEILAWKCLHERKGGRIPKTRSPRGSLIWDSLASSRRLLDDLILLTVNHNKRETWEMLKAASNLSRNKDFMNRRKEFL